MASTDKVGSKPIAAPLKKAEKGDVFKQKTDNAELSKALGGKKTTFRANFNKYIKTGRLTLDKCVDAEQDYSGCKNQYLYHPNMESPQTCGQVKKDLNVGNDFCDDDSQLLVLPKRINAEDLDVAIGLKNKKK